MQISVVLRLGKGYSQKKRFSPETVLIIPIEEQKSASISVLRLLTTLINLWGKMISNAKETSLNEDKDNGAREEPKKKSEKVSNTKGKNVKDGFLWKTIGKISIEPAVILMNLGWTMYWVQTSNLYIEKTCKVGSFFFGNGTTFSNEVVFKVISENAFLRSKYNYHFIFAS